LAILPRMRTYLELIKFSHTVFALPFALTGMFLAARGLPDLKTILFILLAMVGARSAAMGLNRVIDAKIDGANPRTRDRHIPAGLVKKREAWFLIALSLGLLIFSASMLNPLCLKLAPLLILVLFIYSYTKRFTWASHIILGMALGAAPLGAWIAVTGSVDWRILLLSFAVTFWVAGFDIIYALLDIDFDRRYGLHSIPSYLGPKNAITVARFFHLFMAILLLGIYHFFSLGSLYLIGLLFCVALLVYEHSLVKENDFSKLDMAFFTVNGYISITFCLLTFLDIVLGGR
jgi:4-hydroxybenzoate polyprenyltransferase